MRRVSDGLLTLLCVSMASAVAAPPCDRPVYLTIDTGHMGVAELVADTLARHQVRATFFLANEPTQAADGRPSGSTLDDHWAAYWKRLPARGMISARTPGTMRSGAAIAGGRAFVMQPTAGPQRGQRQTMSAAAYCEQLARPARRFAEMTGQPMRGLFRAPGGHTSAALLKAASACGWQHVGWSDAGFLGDELPSDRYPNNALLRQAITDCP